MSRKSLLMLSFLVLQFFPSILTSQWIQTSGPSHGSILSLTLKGTDLYAGTTDGVYLTTDDGSIWTRVSTGIPTNTSINALASNGSNIFAGTYGRGVYLTSDNGTSWTPVDTGLTNLYVYALAVSDTHLFAGTIYGGSVFHSTDNGAHWTQIGPAGADVYALAVYHNSDITNLYAGTDGGSIFLSTNGSNWTSIGSGIGDRIITLTMSDTNLFAGTYGFGVYRSSINGSTWTTVNNGLTNWNVLTLIAAGGPGGIYLFAGTEDSGVYFSTNNGTNWAPAGLTGFSIRALAVNGTNLYAGNGGGDVWKRPLFELITSVPSLPNAEPVQFHLEQNYPNPFNPSTSIRFYIPGNNKVNIKIYDVLGREIRTLRDGEFSAGWHNVTWDGSDNSGKIVASNVYFYRMISDKFIGVRKVVFFK